MHSESSLQDSEEWVFDSDCPVSSADAMAKASQESVGQLSENQNAEGSEK
jgi:hypothetical protein